VVPLIVAAVIFGKYHVVQRRPRVLARHPQQDLSSANDYGTHYLSQHLSSRGRTFATRHALATGSPLFGILMSIQPHAAYQDCLIDDGATLIYTGQDEPMSAALPFPQLCRRNVDA
jgi:hypothetical protein